MAIVYFNQATALALGATIGKTPAATPLTLRLFSNNHTPVASDTEANYTEVSGGGYAALEIDPDDWTVDADSPSEAALAPYLFTFTGATSAPGTVWGYYVTDNNGKALFAEKLSSAFTPDESGDNIIVGVNINEGDLPVILTNKFIVQGTADAQLTQAQFLGALATGILGVETATGILSTLTALPNGTTGTTQAASDNSTKVATTAYADAAAAGITLEFKKTHVQLTDAQIKAATEVSLLAGAANKIVIPICGIVVSDASAGSYNTSPTLKLYFTGEAAKTQIFTAIACFASGSATRRVAIGFGSTASYLTGTFNPSGAGLSVAMSTTAANGNAANYCDITVWYAIITTP